MKKKKIGIMGGTFNPIHIGHLIIAETAYIQHNLDEVMFLPSKNPPHKKNARVILEEHRKSMVELSILTNPNFFLSTIELEREGDTYTIDTMRALIADNPNTEYYFIIGADSLFHIETWKEAEKLFPLIYLLVATRDGVSYEQMRQYARLLCEKYAAQISILDTPTIDISSQFIRKLVAEEKSIRYYVPDKVRDYIRQHNLYQ